MNIVFVLLRKIAYTVFQLKMFFCLFSALVSFRFKMISALCAFDSTEDEFDESLVSFLTDRLVRLEKYMIQSSKELVFLYNSLGALEMKLEEQVSSLKHLLLRL